MQAPGDSCCTQSADTLGRYSVRLPKPGLKVQQGRRFVDAEPDIVVDGVKEYRLGGSRFTYLTGVDKKNL